MGQDILHSSFSEADHDEFRARLRAETKTLKRWFGDRAFMSSDKMTIGLELEAWLVDRNCLPAPRNQEFIAVANDPDVVAELSQFNFELNAPPQALGAGGLERAHGALDALWRRCSEAAGMLDLQPVAIGILPTVRDEMLQPQWMSHSERYRALNEELFKLRRHAPAHINIRGDDVLDYHCNHIMLEAACTSLQSHLRVNQDEAGRFYNASILAAGPLVAASANSPYLFSQSLWTETRVAAFEQATAHHAFHDQEGRPVLRVTLGMNYVRQSMLELFLENLSYPTLLPVLGGDETRLPHLRLHNGTIWRWVRPIVGFDDNGTPHLRIEHRVMPAGPTIVDCIANLAFCYGLSIALGRAETPPESETSFEEARSNFYACAKDGLSAQVRWAGGQCDAQSLLLQHLLPMAKRALAGVGCGTDELDYYFDRILHERFLSGRTGAAWQRSFVECNGKNFQAMLERYVELQKEGDPVHEWAL